MRTEKNPCRESAYLNFKKSLLGLKKKNILKTDYKEIGNFTVPKAEIRIF